MKTVIKLNTKNMYIICTGSRFLECWLLDSKGNKQYLTFTNTENYDTIEDAVEHLKEFADNICKFIISTQVCVKDEHFIMGLPDEYKNLK
jgi:hypothetical protein